MKNTLIAIGYTGNLLVYLNVPLEEAKRRYKDTENDDPDSPHSAANITIVEFDDVFAAYHVYEA